MTKTNDSPDLGHNFTESVSRRSAWPSAQSMQKRVNPVILLLGGCGQPIHWRIPKAVAVALASESLEVLPCLAIPCTPSIQGAVGYVLKRHKADRH